MLRHNLGRGPHPGFGKFNYAEKAEYWAFLWGTLVMALSGAVLWFNDFSLKYLPKWVSDVSTAVHWYEAILATLAILVWHFYFVIFDPDVYPMERAWLTGKVWAEHLRHTRPAYYRALRAAAAVVAPPAPDGPQAAAHEPQPDAPPAPETPPKPSEGG
jgi:cytochrome b subunit of formate dehydrogenase